MRVKTLKYLYPLKHHHPLNDLPLDLNLSIGPSLPLTKCPPQLVLPDSERNCR